MDKAFYQQRPILGAVSRTAGILSLLGSGIMIYDIGRNAEKRSKPKDRIVLSMSICDFLFCFFGPVLGLLMIPSDALPGALGNQITCNIQGFIYMSSGGASSSYNVSLAINYLLLVKYGWSDERLKKAEPFLHLYPLLHGMMYISAFPLQAFNTGEVACQVGSSPFYCWLDDSCTRGEKATEIIFFIIIIGLLQFLAIVVCMVLLYRAIFNFESADGFRDNPDEDRPVRRDLSNSMRIQGIWYSMSYLLWYLPTSIQTGIFDILLDVSPLVLRIISRFTFHFIGFSNAIVYFRPRYLILRSENPAFGLLTILRMTIQDQRPPNAVQRRTSVTLTELPSSTTTTS